MNSFFEALLLNNKERSSSWIVALAGGAALLLLAAGLYSHIAKAKYVLPPGPKGSPVIGNLRQVPAERSELQFAKWAKEYKSDVIYLNLLGQPVVVLNSVEAAADLFDKRGATYLGRPPFVLLEALGFKNNLALLDDGLAFRKIRKVYGNFLSARKSLGYREAQLKYAALMVDEIQKNPTEWQGYLSKFSTRVIFSLAFAIDVVEENDPYFALANKMGYIISNMGNTAITVLDIAPWVEHVPRWIGRFIPSVKFVQEHEPAIREFHQRPFDEVMNSFKAKTLKPSFIGRLIEARETHATDEEEGMKSFTDAEIKGTGGSIYSAGQDTTNSTLTIFVMAMVLTPQVKIQAQKEIDAVTGGKRLPTFDDWKALPIVERLVYETLRFHPAVPNGVPHKSTKEDIYRGMYIPKGKAIVIANAWAMLHDPNTYKNPSTFNPDRFLPVSEGGNGEPIPTGQFGFGRRICPGQYLGFASVWIIVATLLAKFDILPAKDEDGNDILPKLEFTTGITRYGLKPTGTV